MRIDTELYIDVLLFCTVDNNFYYISIRPINKIVDCWTVGDEHY